MFEKFNKGSRPDSKKQEQVTEISGIEEAYERVIGEAEGVIEEAEIDPEKKVALLKVIDQVVPEDMQAQAEFEKKQAQYYPDYKIIIGTLLYRKLRPVLNTMKEDLTEREYNTLDIYLNSLGTRDEN